MRSAAKPKKKSESALVLEQHMRELGMRFYAEWLFCADRKWKADYYTLTPGDSRIALIEIHGSVYSAGRHTRGKGFENDREKMNMAQALGYFVFEFSTGQVNTGRAKEFLAKYWLKRG